MMTAETASLNLVQDSALGENNREMSKESEKLSLSSLSLMTGFPVDFIKSELLMDSDKNELSVEDLRSHMVSFLEKNKDILK